jgi:hypothetical protein
MLTVIAQDPGVKMRGVVLTTRVAVPAERLTPGPSGHRVQVVDFDATTNTLYRARTDALEDDVFEGIDPDELIGNPQFHQQNVYALVSSTLARFEHALGRRVPWAFRTPGHQLKVVPHAFAEANAYYSREAQALLFGYFRGAHGQTVYSCLSSDIIIHETTHALVDALRPRYVTNSSIEQAAFHEGFADAVAILSTFAMPQVLAFGISRLGRKAGERARIGTETIPRNLLVPERLKRDALFLLAEQFGHELDPVRGAPALRASVQLDPSPKYLARAEYKQPHKRGEIFVAALLQAFVLVWSERLLPKSERIRELDPRHVIDEGADTAAYLLTMIIRALDYAPSIDLQFADFLSAVLTSDARLHPDDGRYRYREHLRASFEAFGIAPQSPTVDGLWRRPRKELRYDRTRHAGLRRDPDEVFRFIWENSAALGLDPEAYTWVQSVRPCVRIGDDGCVLEETVIEYLQELDARGDELKGYGVRKPTDMPPSFNVRLYGGGVLILDEFGRVVYHIDNGVRSRRQSARVAYAWQDYKREKEAPSREGRHDGAFAGLHEARARGPVPWRKR